ncbi:PDZ domain-containing protein [Xanthomonas phaseoli pv. dieffenbachiae]|nr:PDZ domain-containing protein [Xanthomonas phaseoli]MBO9833384.1 PDZ domain-containing protein [Xanthomonas phaseoli pv. dieffenbachiae]MBO9837109.1 PDZ domain-containing protein [Xanthomonas phaseoli pv. dieffenbachiae]MBO9839765.1 PDZ domain-containing protein [Xanthomonas phaseoli pv. dieffenbachiae]MBO9859960.1 PDZ domain-containing protein [Xanthomonas phaseoli pv. dieffenbachiae]MBO9864621.1 PDZ domain-containing protein [Xanthomonas phaseoli pv. dieffenbachiae]
MLLLLTATLGGHGAAQATDDKGWFGLGFEVEGEGFSFNPTLTSATIDSVKPVSPAATAGLQVGDAIVSAQGITVAGSGADVPKQAANRKIGQTLRLVIVRGAAEPREVALVAARWP